MAVKRDLGPDISALIHHIQLNESGWFDRAIGRAVKFLIWMYDRPFTSEEIILLQNEVGLTHLNNLNLEHILKRLVDSNELLETAPEIYKLPEAEKNTLDAAVSSAEITEQAVRERLLAIAAKIDKIEVEKVDGSLWERFHSLFIEPFIKEAGARAYELIVANGGEGDASEFISDYKLRFPQKEREAVEAMMKGLFDRNSAETRTYVLRLLNGCFFERASHLPSVTAHKVFGGLKTGAQFRFLLDTNFLFSLLDLHANPSNEAVKLLLDTIKRIPSNIKVGLYVMPETIDEFRRALVNYESAASKIRVTKNIIEAGIKAKLSGVIETYFERCKAANYSISAEEYFSPYHENITAILDEKGVKILRNTQNKYDEDQRVIDDTLERVSFYKQKFINEPRKQKRYEQVWHDVLLWYVIYDRRPEICDTFFDADWLGVTIDYSLLAFDSRKRKGRGISCMVHPAALVQALQLIVPNDVGLESALISSMQLPFLFEEFDIEDEKATQKILGLLSRFESIEDMSEGAIERVLGDRALRGKIQKSDSQSEELTLIENAIVEHAAFVEEKHREAKQELEKVKSDLNRHLQESGIQSNELQAELALERSAREREELAKIEEMRQVSNLQDGISEMKENIKELKFKNELLIEKIRISIKLIVYVLICISSMFAVYYFFWDLISLKISFFSSIVIVVSPVPIFLRLAKNSAKNVTPSELMGAIHFMDRLFWWFYGFVFMSVLGPLIWEQFKLLFNVP